MAGYKIDTTGGGTGVFTIATPNSNTDRTITLPDEAGTVLTSASAVAASQITSALNASGSAPIYACRAWVNFNGQGTVAIRASGNVSSITDLGTGYYRANFTTALPDGNYACISSDDFYGVSSSFNRSTTSVELASYNSSFALRDSLSLYLTVHR